MEREKPERIEISESEFYSEFMECKDALTERFTNLNSPDRVGEEEYLAKMAKLNCMDILIKEAMNNDVGVRFYRYDDGRIGYRFFGKKKMGFLP